MKKNQLNLLGKKFKIMDDVIGNGAFGRTHLGLDVKKNKEVAIKIVSNCIKKK